MPQMNLNLMHGILKAWNIYNLPASNSNDTKLKLKLQKSYFYKCIMVSTNILGSTTVFNIDNNQISILEWFLKIMWHWRLE